MTLIISIVFSKIITLLPNFRLYHFFVNFKICSLNKYYFKNPKLGSDFICSPPIESKESLLAFIEVTDEMYRIISGGLNLPVEKHLK